MSAERENPRIPGINFELGLVYSETPEILFAMLRDFHADIEKRSNAIRKALREEDLSSYERETHSLKSSARLIGAEALSQTAAELESYAKDGDLKSIRLRTPALIVQYRSYISILEPYAKPKTEKQGAIEKDQMHDLLTRLIIALNAFDLSGAQDIIEIFSQSELPEEDKDQFAALVAAVDEVEYDVAAEIAEKLRG